MSYDTDFFQCEQMHSMRDREKNEGERGELSFARIVDDYISWKYRIKYDNILKRT